MIFSIAIDAEYLSYVKSIATFTPTFYGYTIAILASVKTIYTKYYSVNSKLLSKLQIEEIEQEIKSSGSQFGLYF